MYRLMLQNYGLGVLKETTWTDYIKQTLINAGYHYIWQNQRCTQLDIQNIKQRLHDLGVQSMYTIANIETSNKGKKLHTSKAIMAGRKIFVYFNTS